MGYPLLCPEVDVGGIIRSIAIFFFMPLDELLIDFTLGAYGFLSWKICLASRHKASGRVGAVARPDLSPVRTE